MPRTAAGAQTPGMGSHPTDDLLAAGLSGPAVGAGLRAALAAAIDGAATDREAQLRAALDGVA